MYKVYKIAILLERGIRIMGFFGKKIKEFSSGNVDSTFNTIDIFKNSIFQKPGYGFLRENQVDFLKQWEIRRDEKDIIGIMDTGSGKTLLGLLMLYSKLKEGVGTAVYLCPDNQLVEQVVNQAACYGIPTCQFEKTDTYQVFPLEFDNCESILITTFDKLFNGQSVFGIIGGKREIKEIGCLVIDDAHECIKKARKRASIIINRKEDIELYRNLIAVFNDDLEYQGRARHKGILQGEKSIILQIPYWSWVSNIELVLKLLNDSTLNKNNSDIKFNFNMLIDELEYCDCFVSGDRIEITPISIPFDKIPSFKKAKHRYILSATLNNSYSFISDFDLSVDTVRSPIRVSTSIYGERLILSPKRYHAQIDDEIIRELCFEYSAQYNVVVLVPNYEKSAVWINKGAKLINGDSMNSSLNELQSTQRKGVYVVVNRYDGIDLIDDKCRILVIDGMPTKETLKENMEMQYRENSTLVNSKRAQSIEQGLGRAVRSGTDRCVSILMGDDLLYFIGQKNNQKLFSPVIQAQLEFGVNLFKDEPNLNKEKSIESLKEAMIECLLATNDWRTFHKQLINNASKEYQIEKFDYLIEQAELESKAVGALFKNDIQLINEYMNKIISISNSKDDGWYYQLYAMLLYSLDKTRSADLQIIAKEKNSSLLKPINFIKSKALKQLNPQIYKFKSEILRYDKGTDLIIFINDLCSNLEYSTNLDYRKFENAIKKLGEYLGFESITPDKDFNDGPDNFWRGDTHDFIIECKNNSINDISRDEANQMTASIRWYKEYYKNDKFISVMFHNSYKVIANAHTNDEFVVIDKGALDLIKKNLKNMSRTLSVKPLNSWSDIELSKILTEFFFDEISFISKYTKRTKR